MRGFDKQQERGRAGGGRGQGGRRTEGECREWVRFGIPIESYIESDRSKK